VGRRKLPGSSRSEFLTFTATLQLWVSSNQVTSGRTKIYYSFCGMKCWSHLSTLPII